VVGDLSFVVDLDQHAASQAGAAERQDWEDVDDVDAPLDLLALPLQRVGRPDSFQCETGKSAKAVMSSAASRSICSTLRAVESRVVAKRSPSDGEVMTAQQVARAFGTVGGIGWLGKMLVMAVQGGPDPDSIVETIAFLAGLIGVPVAAAATAVYLTRSRPILARIGAAIAGLLIVAVVIAVLQPALTALPGDSWIQAEAVFGLLGVAALLVAVALGRAG